MKKIFFAFLAIGLLSGATSCKKCGHCQYSAAHGGGTSSATCKQSGLYAGLTGDPYQQAQADCVAAGDTWVVH